MGATAAPWGERQARPRTRAAYAAWLENLPPAAATPATAALPVDERLMVGLRRREGVHLPRLLTAAGLEERALAAVITELRTELAPWLAEGLLLAEGPRWRLSDPAGLALSNGVLRRLLAWWERRDGSGRRSSGAAPPPQACAPAATAH